MKSEIKIFLSLFVLYFLFIQWYGWNEESRLSLTRAIVEEKRFEIDSWANLTGDRAFFKGHYYSDKDPGLSLLSTPLYATWKFIYSLFPKNFKESHKPSPQVVGEIFEKAIIYTQIDRGFFVFTSMILLTTMSSCLFASLTAVLIYKLSLLFLKKSSSISLALIYGLATLSFPISLHFWGHAPATFFAFLGFYILFKQKRKKKLNKKLLIIAGVVEGFAILTEISTTLIVFSLFLYSFFIFPLRKNLLPLGLLLGILPFLFYNFAIFGNPFDLATSYIDRRIYITAYPLSPLSQPKILQQSLIDLNVFRHFHFQGFNPWVALHLLFFPYRGIFFYYPLLLFGIIGSLFCKREKTEVIFIFLLFLLFVCLLASRRIWWGGYCFGPRYLAPITPFLFFLILPILKKVGFKFFILFSLYSIFVNFIGLQPAEDWAYDWNLMDIKSDFLQRQNSFQIMANPLFDHYLPLTLKYGPRSPIFEHLVNGYISIDIRIPPLSKGSDFPFSKFHVPFLVLLPLIGIYMLIWQEEIRRGVRDVLP